jgi:peroxiredoxin
MRIVFLRDIVLRALQNGMIVAISCSCFLNACATSYYSDGSTLGAAGVTQRPSINLRLTQADRQVVEIAQLRGKKVLLFLFTTFDLASQAALTPLLAFLKTHPAINAVGVALQPDPTKLLPLYSAYWSIPFPLTFDSEKVIIPGQSDLGTIGAIPTYILLDEQGTIVNRIDGAATARQLEGLLK